MVRRWLPLAVVLLVGVVVGLGAFTFVYAKGYSYLSNDPSVCANCHIMDEHYAAWMKSSHKTVATCNDCHTPHTALGKYYVKARNGFWHSFYFTTGTFPYPLRITPPNHDVVEDACRYCHEPIVESIDHDVTDAITCTRCHRYVGHWVR